LPSALSQHFAISAPFIVSVQAWPLSFIVRRHVASSHSHQTTSHREIPMNEFIAKSRLTRGLIAIAALAVAIYLLGNTDGVRRAIVAISTALFAWIATCELEVFKTEIALKMKQLDWKKELLGKADSCFFDLKLVFEDVSTSLAFKPAGETDEQYPESVSPF
jgi:hypothetical protein